MPPATSTGYGGDSKQNYKMTKAAPNMSTTAGGESDWKEIPVSLYKKMSGYQDIVESYYGQKFSQFEPDRYTSQVVAGTNYRIQYDTEYGTLTAKIYQPLAYTNSPAEVKSVSMDKAVAYTNAGANQLMAQMGALAVMMATVTTV